MWSLVSFPQGCRLRHIDFFRIEEGAISNFRFVFLFSPRFKAWVHWTVWEAAQRPYITWRRPALYHRLLAHRPLGERRGTTRSFARNRKPSSCELNACLSRLWCLLSTAGQALKGSPTRRCCRTSPRLPTSGWLSFAPTPCWATWSLRPRGIQRSPAGWATVMTWHHPV